METSYVDRILEQAGMNNCKAAPTTGTDALKKGKAELVDPLPTEEQQHHRKLVGLLLWLRNLRYGHHVCGEGVVPWTCRTDHGSLGKA